MSLPANQTDNLYWIDEQVKAWRETACGDETPDMVEEKLRISWRLHLAELKSSKLTGIDALADEMGFSLAMAERLAQRRTDKVAFDLTRQIAELKHPMPTRKAEGGATVPRRDVVALPVCKAHESGHVYYEGELCTFEGSLYQATRDTGRDPSDADWICIATGGAPVICGTFDKDRDYCALDIVALGGASFIARSHRPGVCPGPGWQLVAGQGKRGQQGLRGPAGPKVVKMEIDSEGMLSLFNADGSLVNLDLYPVLSKLK